MPSFTEFVRGTIVTATFLNQIEKGLYWLQLDVLRSTMEDALRGLVASHVSMFYDLFNDTSEFDSGAVTPDMSIDTANGVISLPGGFSINTNYYYQSILHEMPATVTKANMLLLREDIANTNVYPSLSCVGTGAAASFAEETTPITSRNVTATLDEWAEDFSTTGNSGAYTVEFDTANGKILLPGGAADAWTTPAQQTSNVVADVIQSSVSAIQRTNGGVSSCYLPDGSLAIAYASKEHTATISNVRLRVLKTDGTLKTWAGNSYIDVTTDAAAHHYTPIVLPISDGNVGVAWQRNGTTDVAYALVNLTAGTVGSPATQAPPGGGSVQFDAGIEPSTDFVWVGARAGTNQTTLYRFAHTASSFGAAVVSQADALGIAESSIRISLDQENDVHLAYLDGTNNLIRYNIWDKSGAAWLYTWGSGDKTIARTVTAPTVENDFQLVADVNQTGSNKFCWVVYTKNNGSTKSSVYVRTINNGTVGSEHTVKSDASNNMLWVDAAYDVTGNVLHVVYADSANGLWTNTVTSAGSLGTATSIKASSVTAASGICINSDQTKLGIAFRDGANDNAASEVFTSSKVLGYSLVAKTWQSVLRTVATTATKYFVTSDEDLPTDTTAVWEITADNGGTWDTVTLGSVGTFSVPGTQIILKVTLQTTDSAVTPEVDSADWKVIVPLIEEEFEWTALSGVDIKTKLRARSSNGSFNPKVHSIGVIVS